MKCQECGYENEEGSGFCEKCGTRLEVIEANVLIKGLMKKDVEAVDFPDVIPIPGIKNGLVFNWRCFVDEKKCLDIPYILLTNATITTKWFQQVNFCFTRELHPLIIISPDVSEEPEQFYKITKENIFIVQATGGRSTSGLLHDIAIYTGGMVLTKEFGYFENSLNEELDLNKPDFARRCELIGKEIHIDNLILPVVGEKDIFAEWFGKAESCTLEKTRLELFEGAGDQKNTDLRIEILRKITKYCDDKEIHQRITRIANLTGNFDLSKIKNNLVFQEDPLSKLGEGLIINDGYISPYFITNPYDLISIQENSSICLFEGLANSVFFIPILSELSKEASGSLTIIAENFSDGLITLMVVNKLRGVINLLPIKTELQNIKNLSTHLSPSNIFNQDHKSCHLKDLPKASKIISSEKQTKIVASKSFFNSNLNI